MCASRNIAEVLSKLTPEERVAVEDLVLEEVMRRADAQDEAADPTGFRLRKAHAEEVAAGIAIPLSAVEAVRAAWRTAARSILAGEEGDA